MIGDLTGRTILNRNARVGGDTGERFGKRKIKTRRSVTKEKEKIKETMIENVKGDVVINIR